MMRAWRRARRSMKNLPLKKVLELIACDKPAPGGGTVAAIACGMAASLVCMVASITMGKERYKEQRGKMGTIANRAKELISQSLDLAEEDSRSYEGVIAAMRMPSGASEGAPELAYKRAIEAPLKVCRASVEILEQCLCLARLGIGSAATDVAMASLAAKSAFEGALAIIGANLRAIADETYRVSVNREIEELNAIKDRLATEVASAAEARLRG